MITEPEAITPHRSWDQNTHTVTTKGNIVTVRAVPAGSGRRRRAGKVELAARRALRDLDSDHAASDLLMALAERLAKDVDDAAEIRDRVAASRELREVLEVLDTAVLPGRIPTAPSVSDVGEDAEREDPFGIGSVPPSVVDTA